MKAMIFAAGLGTRLKPLTDNKPKALVEVKGIPLLEIVITKLISQGYEDIIVNVHHHADMIINFLKEKNNFDINIQISDERDELLDTGGGLLKASWFFDDGEPFLVYNVDVLTNLDMSGFYNLHCELGSLVTLAVRRRETSRYFLLDDYSQLRGWVNMKTGELKGVKQTNGLFPFAFSGIQMVSPKIFPLINRTGKFSITDVYLDLMNTYQILGFDHSSTKWLDVGKIDSLAEAEQFLP